MIVFSVYYDKTTINPAILTGVLSSYSIVRMHLFFCYPCLFELNFVLRSSRAFLYGYFPICIPHILRSLDCYLTLSSLLKYLFDVGI